MTIQMTEFQLKKLKQVFSLVVNFVKNNLFF